MQSVLAVFLLGQDVVMPQMNLYIELDGYSWITRTVQSKLVVILVKACSHPDLAYSETS